MVVFHFFFLGWDFECITWYLISINSMTLSQKRFCCDKILLAYYTNSNVRHWPYRKPRDSATLTSHGWRLCRELMSSRMLWTAVWETIPWCNSCLIYWNNWRFVKSHWRVTWKRNVLCSQDSSSCLTPPSLRSLVRLVTPTLSRYYTIQGEIKRVLSTSLIQ